MKEMFGKEHSVEEYKRAFRSIQEKENIHENQYKMLQVHYSAPSRKLSAPQLADLVGYKRYSAVNLHYGTLGQMVCNEIGYIPPENHHGYPTWTCGLAEGAREDSKSEWVWKMYDNLAIALEELDIVK